MKLSTPKQLKPLVLLLLAVFTLSACKKDKTTEEIKPEVPKITNIQPKDPKPGDMVTITGTGFGTKESDVKVTVGSTEVTISSVTATKIKFTVPTTLTSGSLAVAIKGISAENKDPDGVAITVKPTTGPVPTFTAMAPSSGKTGDVITLTGTNFSTRASDNKVFFATTTGGTVVLAPVKSATATTLTVELPESAVTGGVLIEVNGTNAVPATGFNTTFTVTTAPVGTDVDYIKTLSGTLKFSKFATASKEIGAMMLDRVKSVIYYSDYTILNQAEGQNTVYKVAIEGDGKPSVLTSDARIGKILKITTDASGNVFVLKYEAAPSSYSIYKITPDGAKVTEVIKGFNMFGEYASEYFFYIDAANDICMRPGFKITAAGALVDTGTPMYGIQQKDGGAQVDNKLAYLIQNTDNNGEADNMKFIKWDLSKGTIADAGFTVKNLFQTNNHIQFILSQTIQCSKISWIQYFRLDTTL
ncbi:MAG: hypothetical protein EOP47_18285 [Sphingobacteriaceae bacterium]|nr:MAG: hypothetical protein EOP47_18285 [Sphingobacteriaceae bacterium]